jgi:hypothetical protein
MFGVYHRKQRLRHLVQVWQKIKNRPYRPQRNCPNCHTVGENCCCGPRGTWYCAACGNTWHKCSTDGSLRQEYDNGLRHIICYKCKY